MCLALGHLIQDKLEFVEYWVSMSTWFVDENHAERGAGKLLTFGLVLTSSMTMTTYIYIQYVYFFIKLCIIRCVYIICICVYIYITGPRMLDEQPSGPSGQMASMPEGRATESCGAFDRDD